MKVTIREIADALRISKRPAETRAERGKWPYTEETTRGGRRRLYAIDALPVDVQQALRNARAVASVNALTAADEARQEAERLEAAALSGAALGDAAKAESDAQEEARQKLKLQGLKEFQALPDGPKKQRANARKWVVQAFQLYHQKQGGTREHARHAFTEAFNANHLQGIAIPEWVREQMPKYHGLRNLSEASLQRWDDDLRLRGIMALVDDYGQSKGKSKITTNADLEKVVLGCMLKFPHITPKKIKKYLEAGHPELNIVSAKGIERFMTAWKTENPQLWTYMTNPDKWKNIYMPAFGSQHEEVARLNQLWEMDSTPADWMLKDGRHVVIGGIDMYSRRLKYIVSKSSKAAAVCETFRSCVLAWGVPESIRTDNGKDYVSQHFDGVLREMEIGHELCMPFASEEKGTIERANRTMSHGILDLLPGFIGHNVAERKVIEARKAFASRIMKPGEVVEVELTASELQERLDKWCEYVYGRDSHAGLDNRTPFQVATSWTGKIRRISDVRALDALLEEVAGTRTVSKGRGVQLDHHDYIHADLGPWIGEEVRLKRNGADIGRITVYSLEGEFICEALCHEILGISRAEVATATKHSTKKLIAEQARELKDHKKAVAENIADVVMQHRVDQSQNVTAFPRPSEEYSTPGLQAAADAARARAGFVPEQGGETNAALEKLKADMAKPAPVVELLDTPTRRYGKAHTLEQRIAHNEYVNEGDRRWLIGYQQSPEYRSQKKFHEEFGLVPHQAEA